MGISAKREVVVVPLDMNSHVFCLTIILLLSCFCTACKQTHQPSVAHQVPKPPVLSDSLTRQDWDRSHPFLSTAQTIREFGSNREITLRHGMLAVYAFDTAVNLLDSFALTGIYNVDTISRLTDRLISVVVLQRMGYAHEGRNTHILGIEDGRFRYALGLRTLESIHLGTPQKPDEGVWVDEEYTAKIDLIDMGQRLKIREKYRLRDYDTNAAWDNVAYVTWDSTQNIYRDSTIQIKDAISESYQYDSVCASGNVPVVRLGRYTNIYYQGEWYSYVEPMNQLFSWRFK